MDCNEKIIKLVKYNNEELKEAIELMIQLDDDKNYSLSDIERDKYVKMLKRLKVD